MCSLADVTKTKLLHLIANSRDGLKIHTGCVKGVTITLNVDFFSGSSVVSHQPIEQSSSLYTLGQLASQIIFQDIYCRQIFSTGRQKFPQCCLQT